MFNKNSVKREKADLWLKYGTEKDCSDFPAVTVRYLCTVLLFFIFRSDTAFVSYADNKVVNLSLIP